MTTEIKFTVPGTPKGQGRQRHRIVTPKDPRKKAFVHNYMPTDSANKQDDIRHFACVAMAGRPPLIGPLVVQMAAYMPIAKSWSKKKQAAARAGTIYPTGKPDYDNIAKMQDAIKGIVFGDDAQFVDAHIYKRYSDYPRLVVCVKTKE